MSRFFFGFLIGVVTQWYSKRTSVLEVASSIPAPVKAEVALTENQSLSKIAGLA